MTGLKSDDFRLLFLMQKGSDETEFEFRQTALCTDKQVKEIASRSQLYILNPFSMEPGGQRIGWSFKQ